MAANSPGPSKYWDSLLGTPHRSSQKDPYSSINNSFMHSSASRAWNANRLWEANNSTVERHPILKKFKSDITPFRKEDSKVRFKEFKNNKELDSDYEIIPQRLDFSDSDYKYNKIYENTERRKHSKDNFRIMKNIEKSLEREDSYVNRLYFGKWQDNEFEDPFRDENQHFSQTQKLDLRNIDKENRENNQERMGLDRDWRYNESIRRKFGKQWVKKNSIGDYDLINEYSFN